MTLTTYQVESELLARRLETGEDHALNLNSDVLAWLCAATDRPLVTVMTRFPAGLVFDAEGVETTVQEMLPDARFLVGTLSDNAYRRGAGIYLRGHQKPFLGEAETSASALLAALLRAFSARATINLKARAA